MAPLAELRLCITCSSSSYSSSADTLLLLLDHQQATFALSCNPAIAGFGVPNRRRRIFILASMHGDARDVLLGQVNSASVGAELDDM